MQIDAVEVLLPKGKDDKLAFHVFRPTQLGEAGSGVFGSGVVIGTVRRIPRVQKAQEGDQTRVLSASEPLAVLTSKGSVILRDTLFAPFTLFLAIDFVFDIAYANNPSGRVPKKVRRVGVVCALVQGLRDLKCSLGF